MAFDPTKDYITREEKFLTVMAGNSDINFPEPITRFEHYLAAMCDPDNYPAPAPITRLEHYLSAIAQKISEGGGGGGGLGELIASEEYTVKTTSTSANSVGTFTLPSGLDVSGKRLFVRIRDKAGVRDGYFYGSDNYGVDGIGTAKIIYIGSSGAPKAISTSTYGLYATILSDSIVIYSKYNSSSSTTIDGTYTVEVYLQDIS